jgi:hypothetical protein
MGNLSTMQKGMAVAAFLAILTIAEYFFAVEIHDDLIRFLGLSVAALAKAWLIMQFFMHLTNVFHPSSEGH